jgi:hypothetical protein
MAVDAAQLLTWMVRQGQSLTRAEGSMACPTRAGAGSRSPQRPATGRGEDPRCRAAEFRAGSKRFPPPSLLLSMNRVLGLCGRFGLPALAAVTERPWWTAAVLGMILATSLLAEWQRRITLTSLVRDARPGTVIVQGRGFCGPALRVRVGGSPEHDLSPGKVDAR